MLGPGCSAQRSLAESLALGPSGERDILFAVPFWGLREEVFFKEREAPGALFGFLVIVHSRLSGSEINRDVGQRDLGPCAR